MTGGHDSVTSICLACHVYTPSCHKFDEAFSTVVLCLQSVSNAYRNSEKCPLCQWANEAGSIERDRLYYSERALAHTILALLKLRMRSLHKYAATSFWSNFMRKWLHERGMRCVSYCINSSSRASIHFCLYECSHV